MDNELVPSGQKPIIPGIGVSGMVMCPFFKGACLKGGCELFVELNCGGTFVARCTLSWLSVLSIEMREAIDKLKGNLKDNKIGGSDVYSKGTK